MSEKELDPEGSEFQPLRAIYDPAFEVSDNVVVQDNVEKCIAVIEGRVRTKKVVDQTVVKGEEEELKLERQFKPEQLAQPTRPRKVKKGVLDRMKEVEGPLGGLRRLMEQGTKARVWTRGVQVMAQYLLYIITRLYFNYSFPNLMRKGLSLRFSTSVIFCKHWLLVLLVL